MSDPVDKSIKDYLGETRAVPPNLVQGVKNLVPGPDPKDRGMRGKCPHCGKPVTPFKDGRVPFPWSVLWYASAAASFTLSFLFRDYFMQFLVLTLLLGGKGILDQRARTTQILIYKALASDKGGERHRLHQHTTRL